MTNHDLEIARRLADAGVPLFIARPNSSELGFRLPDGWQHTAADPTVVDRWQPGDALCAVMGVVCDAIDVDPRNGGSEDQIEQWPISYGRQRTPRGGTHDLISPLGIGKCKLAPGIDLQGGKPDGSSRGFIFIAPTVRHGAAYSWESEPKPLAVEDSGRSLAALVKSAGESSPDLLEGLAENRKHDGPIPVGQRDEMLFSYAAWMRNSGFPMKEAETLMQARWGECEQPAGNTFPLKAALAKVDAVYKRYAAGTAPIDQGGTGKRSVRLTRASEITPRPTKWLWDGRIPLGAIGLVGGREGIGKSTVCYTLASDITRGVLPGHYRGFPRGVIVAATEDSWEHTIIPRLMAASANLDRVTKIDVVSPEGYESGLILPADLGALEKAIRDEDAALVLLDPLLSRVDASLDTHKDAEVRRALEPLTGIADATGAAVIGIVHVNKSGTTDPLTALTASRAFVGVARSVQFVMTDPDDESVRLLGTAKNNLGRSDLPTLTFKIESIHVADHGEGPVHGTRANWQGEIVESIRDMLAETGEVRTASGEAAQWLEDFLMMAPGGRAESSVIKAEGKLAGHTDSALRRAREKLRLVTESEGFPRVTYWRFAGMVNQVDDAARSLLSSRVTLSGDRTTDTTDTTDTTVSQ
jgi:hypothetical protein